MAPRGDFQRRLCPQRFRRSPTNQDRSTRTGSPRKNRELSEATICLFLRVPPPSVVRGASAQVGDDACPAGSSVARPGALPGGGVVRQEEQRSVQGHRVEGIDSSGAGVCRRQLDGSCNGSVCFPELRIFSGLGREVESSARGGKEPIADRARTQGERASTESHGAEWCRRPCHR